jgi:hypothetical protein
MQLDMNNWRPARCAGVSCAGGVSIMIFPVANGKAAL